MSFLGQLIGAALGIASAVATGGAALWYFAASVAVTTVSAQRQARKAERAARDAYNASLKDRQVMLDITPDAPRTLVLGRVRTVEGIRRRFSSGANRERLVMVVSFAGHEIDGFEGFYFNDQPLTLDGDGWVQDAPYFKGSTVSEQQLFTLGPGGSLSVTVAGPIQAGSVTAWEQIDGEGGWTSTTPVTASGSGTTITLTGGTPGAPVMVNWVRTTGSSLARIRPFVGTAGQNIGAILAAEYPGAPISATDRFAGIACAIVELTFDQDAYPSGLPNITALIRGARVLDPRTGTTVWSENPALHAYHYARHPNGWAVPVAEIRTADVIAAANACDISTVFTQRFPNGSTSTVTLPRHRCGIVIALDGDTRSAMDDIMATMGGRWGWAGGTWRMRAAAMAAPVWTVDDSVLAYRLDDNGQPSEEPVVRASNGVPRDQRVTRVTGTCTIPAERWQVLPFPAIEDAVLIARDGQPLPLEVQLAGVTHPAHAQHLGSIMIREAQAGLRLELLCNVTAWPLELFDVGQINLARLGMSGKTAEVIGWSWSPAAGVQLSLAEITPAMFAPVAELVGVDPAPNSSLPPPWQVPSIAGLALTSSIEVSEDGAVDVSLTATWTPITDTTVLQGGWVEVEWRYADTAAEAALVRADTLTSHTLRGLLPGRAVVVRVRAVNGLPVRGPWSLPVALITDGDTIAPEAPTGLAAVAVVGGLRITWDPCTARDYLESELRYGPSYAAGVPIYVGSGTSHTWVPPADAEYKLNIVHRDRSRNDSTPADLITSYLTVGGATVLRLLASSIAFVFPSEAATTSSSPAVTFTALLYGNVSGTATFVCTAYDSVGGTLGTITLGGTGNTRTLTAAQFVTYASTARVVVVATLGELEDQVAVVRANNGSDALQGELSNESHTVPALADGTVTSYALSGTIIYVAEGTTLLTYDGVGTSPGTYNVSATGTNITPGSIIASGPNAAAQDASNMTADVAQIAFTATGKTLGGVSFTGTRVQRFAKARAGAQGTAGAAGAPGATGQSTHRIYRAASIGSPPATPSNTTNGAVPSGWSGAPVALAVGQEQYQSDGVTPAGSTTTTWGTPYPSYLKVGSLDAISANLGTITAGTLNTSGWVRVDGSTTYVVPVPGVGPSSETAAIAGNVGQTATVGVYGVANGGVAGLLGSNNSTSAGAGVYGRGRWGVYGQANTNTNGVGVYALANAVSPNNTWAMVAEGLGDGSNSGALRVIGSSRFDGQLRSTVATGTEPLVVTSTTLVSNLNVERLNGRTSVQYTQVNTANLAAGASIENVSSGSATITFNGTNSPGAFTGSNTWLVVAINGTFYKLPVWQLN